jgi:hypothetical protein
MKFLCVACDSQMKLVKDQIIAPNAKGSLAMNFECPECLMAIGLMTNPFETQLVTSLGVEIGGKTVPSGEATPAGESKCPFSVTARQAMVGEESSDVMTPMPTDGQEVQWTAQARVRLDNIPDMVRSYAKRGIEQFAQEQGFAQITEECLDRAKEHFDM